MFRDSMSAFSINPYMMLGSSLNPKFDVLFNASLIKSYRWSSTFKCNSSLTTMLPMPQITPKSNISLVAIETHDPNGNKLYDFDNISKYFENNLYFVHKKIGPTTLYIKK